MGFEVFLVGLLPKKGSPLHSGNDMRTFHRLINEVQTEWPTLCYDAIEAQRCFPPKSDRSEILVSETMEGLFQVYLVLGNIHADAVSVSVLFAYTNPRSIYEPVFSFIEWAMAKYELYCDLAQALDPDQPEGADKIYSVEGIRSTLLPSIEYNRKLWQWTAQTEEEASIRPGDAVEKFIGPLLVSATE